MATIQSNNSDLRSIVREAVERLCEAQWCESEPLAQTVMNEVFKRLRKLI